MSAANRWGVGAGASGATVFPSAEGGAMKFQRRGPLDHPYLTDGDVVELEIHGFGRQRSTCVRAVAAA